MTLVRKRWENADLSGVDWEKVDAATDRDIERWSREDPDTPPPATPEELAAGRVVRPQSRGREPAQPPAPQGRLTAVEK